MEKQKYGYLRPLIRIKDTKDQGERKVLARNWFKFAFRCIVKKRRSENCGYELFHLSKKILNYLRKKLKHYLKKVLMRKLLWVL